MVELNFNSGDEVRLRLSNREIDGIVVDSEDSSIIMLKLDSGYNIGVPKENILGSRILKRYGEVKRDIKIEQKKELPKIGLIITGGTIASKASQATGGVKPITDVNEFLSFYPGLLDIVNVKKLEIPYKIFSENMTSEHWIKMAEIVKNMLDDQDIKGVIVTHGTDTLHYTSAALSFFLRDLGKPVVLTYSQRSIDRASSDAKLNLECAARLAISDCSGVYLVGHANSDDDFCYAMKGTKVRKLHSSRRDAFRSVNADEVAKISSSGVEFLGKYDKRDEKKKVELDVNFTDKVALLKFYPGQDPSILDFYALKYKGVVIEAAGLGQVNQDWISSLKRHIKNGLVVCITTQTVFGRVDPYVYSTAREMLDAGCIFLEDMMAESAFVKLGWVLGHYGWKTKVREKMLENFAGELNSRLIFDSP